MYTGTSPFFVCPDLAIQPTLVVLNSFENPYHRLNQKSCLALRI